MLKNTSLTIGLRKVVGDNFLTNQPTILSIYAFSYVS